MATKIDTVLLKVASRCNINCRYCYIYNMGDDLWQGLPKRISTETLNTIASQLRQLYFTQAHEFAVVLHGGEPLLLGADRLELTLSTLRSALPFNQPIHIQTNGILITDHILNICARTNTALSVSLDGPTSINDKNRVDHKGQGTHARIVEGIRRLKAHRAADTLFTGILAVVDPQTDPIEVYQYLKDLGAPSLDFLYRDGNHDALPHGKRSIRSTEYGEWLVRLFDFYVQDANPIPVRILDDIVKLLLGGFGIKEGIGVTDYGIVVIDTDGRINKNDTLKSAFQGADRFRSTWTIFDTELARLLNDPEYLRYHVLQQPSCVQCDCCPNLQVCGGGMPAHRWSKDAGFSNPTVFCADQMLVIEHIRARLSQYRRTG